jgi:hypothetical protein
VKRLLATAAFALALIPSTGHALSSKSFDFCGGAYGSWTGFAFCASVNVTVTAASNADGLTHAAGAWTVTMDIVNKSGYNGSYVNSLFIQMGLDNLPVTSPAIDFANPANVAIFQNNHLVCLNVVDQTTGKANCYNVQENKAAAGGVKVDFLSASSNGVSLYALQSCASNVSPAGLVTCAGHPVRIQFDVNQNFDLTNVQAYVKAQGQLGSTECETGQTGSLGCMPTTTVPEPGSMTLLATGLVGAFWMGRRRRKTRPSLA